MSFIPYAPAVIEIKSKEGAKLESWKRHDLLYLIRTDARKESPKQRKWTMR